MACNAANQPLLSGLVESTPQTNRGRRLIHRCRSAPLLHVHVTNVTIPPEFLYTCSNPKPNSRNMAIFLFVYLVVGTICFYAVKSQMKGVKNNGILDGIIDSVYFCVVTMTTIGYGDIVPDTVLSKLLTCTFVLVGMAVFGVIILSKAVEFLGKKQDILLVKAMESYQIVDLNHILNEIESETNTVRHKCIRTFIILLLLIILGTIVQVTVGRMDVVDAFYCVFATITTIGYGDKTFLGNQILFVYWIFITAISLARLFLYVAEFHTQRRLRALVKWVLARKMTLRHEDLEAAYRH